VTEGGVNIWISGRPMRTGMSTTTTKRNKMGRNKNKMRRERERKRERKRKRKYLFGLRRNTRLVCILCKLGFNVISFSTNINVQLPLVSSTLRLR
jgi:hypothetical protein